MACEMKYLFLLLIVIFLGKIRGDSPADCDFSKERNGNYTLCSYNLTLGPGHHCFSWEVCNGQDAHWRGGPKVDGSGSLVGGYIFIDPSAMASFKSMNKSRMAWFITPIFVPTKAVGKCLTFQYNIQGLSAKSLNVRLYNYDKNTSYPIWQSLESTLGNWKKGTVSFTSDYPHQIVFEAVPNPKNPASRGHIAVDNIELLESACPGDCMFDADTCTWKNDNKTDELDFEMGRGSISTVTGPTNDHTSDIRNGIAGGYIYLNSKYPRGPGDKAHLFSQKFNATAPDEPRCMSFWVSAYGPGIGKLSLYLIDLVNKIVTDPIWQLKNELTVNSLNKWTEARVTISYPNEFNILIEAEVGKSDTGDIAIDDLSFLDGPCPVLPQVASVGNGECSFFSNPCQWDVVPVVQEVNTRPMWSVVHGADTLVQPDGHTSIKDDNRHDGYMRFWTSNYMHSSLDASSLVGPQISAVDTDMCIALWVYMYSSSKTELGVGSLSIILQNEEKNTTLWSLSGSQNSRWFYAQTSFRTKTKKDRITFLGIKGRDIVGNIAIDDVMVYRGKCTTLPQKAKTHEADCSFDLDTCLWTVSQVSSDSDPRWSWLKPRKLNGPRLVRDHTFDIETDGFLFVEILNAPRQIVTELKSIQFKGNEGVCLTFYYAAYGSEDGASLRVMTRGGQEKEWWNVTRSLGDSASASTTPKWNYGQVLITNPTDYIIIFEAKVRISAFALDDIRIKTDVKKCPSNQENFVKFTRTTSSNRRGRRLSTTTSSKYTTTTTPSKPIIIFTSGETKTTDDHSHSSSSISTTDQPTKETLMTTVESTSTTTEQQTTQTEKDSLTTEKFGSTKESQRPSTAQTATTIPATKFSSKIDTRSTASQKISRSATKKFSPKLGPTTKGYAILVQSNTTIQHTSAVNGKGKNEVAENSRLKNVSKLIASSLEAKDDQLDVEHAIPVLKKFYENVENYIQTMASKVDFETSK